MTPITFVEIILSFVRKQGIRSQTCVAALKPYWVLADEPPEGGAIASGPIKVWPAAGRLFKNGLVDSGIFYHLGRLLIVDCHSGDSVMGIEVDVHQIFMRAFAKCEVKITAPVFQRCPLNVKESRIHKGRHTNRLTSDGQGQPADDCRPFGSGFAE